MIAHFRYLKYVILHKLYVFQAGRMLACPLWQLIIHDWQKFTPAEWNPYVQTFYGPKRSKLEKEWLQGEFDRAWLHHQKLGGKHHWQYWVLIQDEGNPKALRMPHNYVREMVADWTGAGRAITGSRTPREWYEANKHKMILHPESRNLAEKFIKHLN